MGFIVDKNGRSFYQTNAFYIKFNPSYLDDEGIPLPEAIPVFFHEYAHLIQDTTTIYGSIDFLNFHDSIQDVYKLTRSTATLSLPVSEKKNYNNYWISTLYNYKKCSYPTNEWPSEKVWAFEEFTKPELKTFKYQNNIFDTPVIRGRFIDNTLEEEDIIHEIGVREIKEAYSMAVEYIHAKKVEKYSNIKEFQYVAIERILSKIFGSVSNIELIVICHWCLNSIHPAVELTKIINDIKKEYGSLPHWKELYDFLRKRFVENNPNLIEEIKEKYSEILLSQSAAGKNDMLYQSFSWYISHILKNLEVISNRKSYFPVDTALCDPSFSIKDFIQSFPIFLYENNGEISYSLALHEKTPEFVYFFRSLASVIQQLHKNQKEWRCILYNLCEFKEEVCERKPWKRWKEKPKCNYCSACHYLNLTSQTKLS